MWKSLKALERPGVRTNLHRLVVSWTRGSRTGLPRRDIGGHRAYRVRSRLELGDPWENRIVALSDGRPVSGIVDELFRQEALAGAWVVDIALWRGIFEQSVTRSVDALAGKGYIFLTRG